MGSAFLHGNGGGGNPLNFDVVRYASEADLPESAKENTIALFTDVDIPSWFFCTEQPEAMENGQVWIRTGTSSPVTFNALKKNEVEVYPLSAKQKVGSKLVDVPVLIYQNGEWREWCLHYFLAGEGLAEGYTGFSSENGSTNELLAVYVFMQNNVRTATSDSKQTIDVTNYSKLTFHIDNIGIGGNNDNQNVTVYFKIMKDGNEVSSTTLCSTTVKDAYAVTNKTVTIKLSAITGEIKMRVHGTSTSTSYHSTACVRMDSIRFE